MVVGSLAGRAPIPFQAHYSATKAALDALTLALRLEVAPLGVGVSLVEPGDIGPRSTSTWRGDSGPPSTRSRAGVVSGSFATRSRRPRARNGSPPSSSAALDGTQARVRYTVGPDSLLVPLGRRVLPDWLSLSLIRNHFNV